MLVAALRHALRHSRIYANIGPGGPAKLLLDLHITLDCKKVHGLMLHPLWPTGHCLRYQGGTWQLLPGALEESGWGSRCWHHLAHALQGEARHPGGRLCPRGVLAGRAWICRAAAPGTCLQGWAWSPRGRQLLEWALGEELGSVVLWHLARDQTGGALSRGQTKAGIGHGSGGQLGQPVSCLCHPCGSAPGRKLDLFWCCCPGGSLHPTSVSTHVLLHIC